MINNRIKMLIHKINFEIIDHKCVFHFQITFIYFLSSDRVDRILELIINTFFNDSQKFLLSLFPTIWIFKFIYSNFSYLISFSAKTPKPCEGCKTTLEIYLEAGYNAQKSDFFQAPTYPKMKFPVHFLATVNRQNFL